MEQDRRRFITHSLTLAAAPMFAPHLARGANNRLAYGVIGSGGARSQSSRASSIGKRRRESDVIVRLALRVRLRR
jgi:hypothetical protein